MSMHIICKDNYNSTNTSDFWKIIVQLFCFISKIAVPLHPKQKNINNEDTRSAI